MRETAKELATLQALIDRSLRRTGPHMKGIIHPGKYSLSAKQVVKLLDGMRTIAVAAPAPSGHPLVAPMDGWFLHGKFCFSSAGDAVRIKGLRKRPRASIAYFEGERFLINAHGPVELMFKGHPMSVRSTRYSTGTMGAARSTGATKASTCGSTPTASSRTHARRTSSPPSGCARRTGARAERTRATWARASATRVTPGSRRGRRNAPPCPNAARRLLVGSAEAVPQR